MNRLAYQKGYKYRVKDKFFYSTGIIGHSITTKYVILTLSGRLVIEEGYTWNGPPKFILDTVSLRRASLVYDALYQLIKEGTLPYSLKNDVDNLLIKICKEDGMRMLRRWWISLVSGAFETRVLESRNPVLFAPEK